MRVNSINSNKLPFKVKFAYGLGEIGKNSIFYLTNFFLLYFYTDVIKIPAYAATIILLASRIWSIIADPIMGVICDKTKSKHGKCRFYFRNFSIPAGFCIFLSFFVPDLADFWKIIWVGSTYMISCTLNTILNVPMNTFIPRITDDKYERVSLSQYKGIMTLVPNTLIPAVTLPMAELFGGGDMTVGFAIAGSIYGVIFTVSHLVCYSMTKGYEKNYEEENGIDNLSKKPENLNPKDMLKALSQNKYSFLVATGWIFFAIYASIQGSTLVYYLQYNINNKALMAVYSVIANVAGILPLFFLKIFVKKFGNAKSCVISCFIVVFGTGIRFITRDSFLSVLFLGWALEGLGINLFAALLSQCMFDSMIYGEWKTGVKIEALTMSVLSLGQKIGLAIGGVAGPFLLTLVKYNPDLAVQPQKVLNLFFAENIVLPIIMFSVLVFVFLYVTKLEKQLPKMQEEIEKRKLANA